ncbi:Hypothetical protein R9X50_00399900 [Acrodontium crateriforme]|uniref:Thioesterase family protein n=1 Tax=Acrodontium crateriforme TaxID=150365 RepID=A0AAQ3M6S1_9PEZI|nr:Hypothetical protein R9X50_00399900 [Acrodontium crateriforme]
MSGFSEATAVGAISSHTYSANLQEDWCIGSVPHGGYVTSVIQQAVRQHFATTLRKQDQPHTLSLHLEFLRRTQVGPAEIIIKDVKLGRQTTTIHVTLRQDGRDEIVGYISNINLDLEKGVSFDTHWSINPKCLPVDLKALERDADRNWCLRVNWPFIEFRKATTKVNFYFQRGPEANPSIVDQWVSLANGEGWTNESIGFVVDIFPQIIESFILRDLASQQPGFEDLSFDEKMNELQKRARMWYPTLLLNLDMKKALPAAGVKWLFVRLQAKSIKNGRYDLEIIVQDAAGELVALSHHVCMAVSADRNLAARRKVGDGQSKL